MKHTALTLALALSLSACASSARFDLFTSAPACPSDWRAQGAQDGRDGVNAIEELQRACAPSPADQQAYSAGVLEGFEAHCAVQGAYDAGRRGRPLSTRCTGTVALLQEANERGRAYRAVERKMDRLLTGRTPATATSGDPFEAAIGPAQSSAAEQFAQQRRLEQYQEALRKLSTPLPR